jgi:hypothetical protein
MCSLWSGNECVPSGAEFDPTDFPRSREVLILAQAGLEAASCECYRIVRDEYERLLG